MLLFPFSTCHRDLGNVDKMRTTDLDFKDGTEVSGKEQDRVGATIRAPDDNEVGERAKRKAKLGSTSGKRAENMGTKHAREEQVRGSGSGAGVERVFAEHWKRKSLLPRSLICKIQF